MRDEGQIVQYLMICFLSIPSGLFPQDGITALMYASGDGFLEVVNALLSAGADANASSNVGDEP